MVRAVRDGQELWQARQAPCPFFSMNQPDKNQPAVPVEVIERRIYLIRGYKVMLSHDLAELYQVETRGWYRRSSATWTVSLGISCFS